MIVKEWRTFILLDFETGVQKPFLIREFNFTEIMARNDLCFCGSGIKQKKCHPDIDEKSVIANLLKVISLIENERKTIEYSICEKGCNDCCGDYFKISIVEFFNVLQHLNKAVQLREYVAKSKELIKELLLPEDDSINIENFPPCIFIDDISGECKIYEVRPILCRLYGNEKTLTRCPKIMSNQSAYNNLIELSHNVDIINNIDNFLYAGQYFKSKQHPLLYWFSTLTDDGGFKYRKTQSLFEASFQKTVNEFMRISLL